jgi:hypothetical protein
LASAHGSSSGEGTFGFLGLILFVECIIEDAYNAITNGLSFMACSLLVSALPAAEERLVHVHDVSPGEDVNLMSSKAGHCRNAAHQVDVCSSKDFLDAYEVHIACSCVLCSWVSSHYLWVNGCLLYTWYV